MFTGIVEDVGKIIDVKKGANSSRLIIGAEKIFSDMNVGDSVAVNGVCLTVTDFEKNMFWADVMSETLSRSSLGSLKKGSLVNLERAMAANGRFGGHIVSGHIDGTGVIKSMKKDDIAVWVSISAPKNILKFIVEKGSVALDGISLTVAEIGDDEFKVSVIPHTGGNTSLLLKKAGDIVNIENDIIGKYVERLMSFKTDSAAKSSGISLEFLADNGFF